MKAVIIFGDKQKAYAKQLIDELPGEGKFQVEIKKHTKKRTLDQNALLWKMFTELGNELGYTAREMHDEACRVLLPPVGYEFMGQSRERMRGTSDLNTAECAQLAENLFRWALNEFGVLLEMPEDRRNAHIEER